MLVDVERTRGWYETHADLAARCSCANCQNFRAAAPLLPKEADAFLRRLGLTLSQPAEIMEWCREDDDRNWYTLQYHLVGTLLEQAPVPAEIAPEVTAGFTEGSGPFLEGFPEPFFQLFLDIRIPWMLKNGE